MYPILIGMSKITRSHKKMDPDIKAVFATYRALKASSSSKMLEENLRFVAGHFGYEISPFNFFLKERFESARS